MSSREIAAVVKSRHDKVKLSMERLQEKGLIQLTPMGEVNEGGQTVQVYHVGKRDSYICVAQLSPEFTAVLVDRWQELESKLAPRLPSVKELALMVIKAEEEKEVAMLEVDRLQGVCNTITAQFAVGMTPSKFAKQFNGCNVKLVNKSLVKLNMLQQSKEGYIPTSYSRDRYFKVTFQPYTNGDKEGISAKAELTLAGAKWLYKAYLSGKLSMRSCWDGVNSHIVFDGEVK